ncbi:MAG: rhomboid family intramembrane serine protease [Calditrichaeota bacterium]|nr:MAG: rhomboid family intramembrane serine protease [Calditrichota bacterium]
MIPLRDSTRSHTFPGVTISIIVVNALVFFYELSLGPKQEWLFKTFGLIPQRFLYLVEYEPLNVFGIVIPFFTSMFLHGGWMHFLGNMWFLWIFGDNVEDSMGHKRFIVFYLLCGLGAAIAHLYFNQQSTVPTIGASGAIAGVMGAYMVQYPRGRVLTLIPIFFFIQLVEIPAYIFLLIWMALQTIQGLVSLGMPPNVGGVAWWAHIGGFVLGAILIFLFRRPRRRDFLLIE